MRRATTKCRLNAPPAAWLRPGVAVTYHRVRGGLSEAFPPIATRVRSEPWQLGDGTWVVLLDGISGGVASDALMLASVPPTTNKEEPA